MNDEALAAAKKFRDITVTSAKMKTASNANGVTVPAGDYVKIGFGGSGENDDELIVRVLASELKKIANARPGGAVLVIGPGNPEIQAESLGPRAVGRINATMGLRELFPGEFSETVKVCAFCPREIGAPGASPGETVEMLVSCIQPDLIVIVDSLEINDFSCAGRTIMANNAGFRQNGGTAREYIPDIFGKPAVVIGIPLIADAASITNDVIEAALPAFFNGLFPPYGDRLSFIKTALSREIANNEMYAIESAGRMAERGARIIARGIDLWLNEKIIY